MQRRGHEIRFMICYNYKSRTHFPSILNKYDKVILVIKPCNPMFLLLYFKVKQIGSIDNLMTKIWIWYEYDILFYLINQTNE